MKEIGLTFGKVALVDDCDFDKISKFKWHAFKNKSGNWYARHRETYAPKKSRVIGMHEFILRPEKGFEVDHKNRDSLDNRRENLRIGTRSQNNGNTRKQKGCASMYKGVRCSEGKYWTSYIWIKNKQKYLGCFGNQEDAARAYNEAAKEYFGEFALLNIIPE